jgi:hypothetical protein
LFTISGNWNKRPEEFMNLTKRVLSRLESFISSVCVNEINLIYAFFFFPLIHADTILKKYSSTVATIFTGIASAVLFGHALTMNFILGISIVFISMHQVNIRPCIYFIYFVHRRRGLEEQEGG